MCRDLVEHDNTVNGSRRPFSNATNDTTRASGMRCHVSSKVVTTCEKLIQCHADKQLGQETPQVCAEDLQVPRSELLNASSDAVQRGEVDLQHLHISRWLCVGAQTMPDNL